ncbi:hypothetical protein BPNPMPFG_000875 [Mesorhizobium sp. AR07]|uniref:hypothetical protein n=1 Tax=Mesorhizobium sp. AR07 TaxID=2865838 RepID=UPI00215E0B34|nr:hypothetical protein [Mesorhizobium sp. AR07]UVK45348.1 hypothetical protein BPNPMPFG_000875 [Mesorhizobium sp. AR07]
MPASEALLAAVSRLDMIELCSRIITNPERNAPRATVAEVYALAKATEGLWAIALETHILLAALETVPWTVSADIECQKRVDRQLATVRDLLTPLSPIPTRQENDHASSN